MLKNEVRNISSQCQVVFFNWKYPIYIEDLIISDLADSEPIDVSKYLLQCDFSKNLAEPAGTFEISLPNDRDWKQVLQRGSWGLIYMSQDGDLAIPKETDVPDINLLKNQKKKLRGIVYVERVTSKGRSIGDDGSYDVDFIVSGRDFGIVYLENEIFYNQLYAEGKWQEAVSGQLRVQGERTVPSLLETLHKGFFSPQELGIPLEGDSLLQSVPLQWLMPNLLFQALELEKKDNRSFYGSIDNIFNFSKSACSYPVDNPMSLINGKAWDRLKSYSIEQFHELFPETDENGYPKLTFRYIPWKTSKGKALGSLNNLVESLINVPRVLLKSVNFLEWDIGEDTHARYNYFLTVVDTSLFSRESSVADLQDTSPDTGFPRIQKNSIRRHGLRLMYATVNALIQLGSEKVNPELLKLHNELMLEYWNNAVFLESGSISMVGSNEIKLGKVLEIEAGHPYHGGKIFYIEGYTDSYSVDNEGAGFWQQNLTLTRGMYPGKIAKRGEEYTDNGEFTRFK
jgi:hypothetical protein